MQAWRREALRAWSSFKSARVEIVEIAIFHIFRKFGGTGARRIAAASIRPGADVRPEP
jgi:hypothetical protein